MGYTNSPLVSYTRISPNRTSPRTHAIDRITIHCIVGQWTAKQGCDYFVNTSAQASANYVVGKDGSIGLCVEEKDRSWCSSNSPNDHRAVTIETASDTAHPYAVTDAALKSLINLCEDICRRNGKTKLLWFGDKEKSLSYTPKQNEMVLTVHRWFANKACPGEYLYARQGMIADEVTKRLNEEDDDVLNVDKMTDEDVLKLWNRIQTITGKQPVSSTLAKELAAAKAAGITDGTNPGAPCTRAQAAVMTYRAAKK